MAPLTVPFEKHQPTSQPAHVCRQQNIHTYMYIQYPKCRWHHRPNDKSSISHFSEYNNHAIYIWICVGGSGAAAYHWRRPFSIAVSHSLMAYALCVHNRLSNRKKYDQVRSGWDEYYCMEIIYRNCNRRRFK